MSRFRYALFYFQSKNVSVEDTDIITDEYKHEAQKQITQMPNLESDDGWIEVQFQNRRGPPTQLSAKILLLGSKSWFILIHRATVCFVICVTDVFARNQIMMFYVASGTKLPTYLHM